MTSPAEKLAKAKSRKRSPRNNVVHDGPVVCHCRKRREALNLSLRDVGKAIGMSQAGLFKVEHGGDCQITTAMNLAAFYGAKIDELWTPKPKE